MNDYENELQSMTNEQVLAAIVTEREARRLDRLELAFAESVRRGLWMEDPEMCWHTSRE